MKKIFYFFVVFNITISVFAQTDPTIKCRLWNPFSFCQLPDSIKLPDVIYFASVSMRPISCRQIDTSKNITGVWVTFQSNKSTELHLKGNFKNISLINSVDKDTIHPIAFLRKQRFMNSDEPIYDYYDFITEDHYFVFEPKQKYDLFFVFRKSNKGDKLVLEDLLEGIIEK